MLETVREWCDEVRTTVASELEALEADLKRGGAEESDLEAPLQALIDSFSVRIRSGDNSRRKTTRGRVKVGNDPAELFGRLSPGVERLLEAGESVWLELVQSPSQRVLSSLPLRPQDPPNTLVPESVANGSAVAAMSAQLTENNKALLQHLTDQGVQKRRQDEVIFQLMMKLADQHAASGEGFDPTAAIAALAPVLAQVAAIMGARMEAGPVPAPSSPDAVASSGFRPVSELTPAEADAELGPMWSRALELIKAHPQLLTAERRAAAAVALAAAAV